MDLVTARRILLMFAGLAVTAASLTVVFLSMRAVMRVGGYCASGGPYEIAVTCPQGTEALLPLGIFAGLAGLTVYAVNCAKLPGPRLALLAWSVLFLSLGWNFWEFGLNPPGEDSGTAWGWIVCGVVFVVMGGLPLLGLAQGNVAKQLFWADAGTRMNIAPARLRATVVRAPATPPSQESITDELERLTALHRAGDLTDEEFASAKRLLLEQQ